MSNVRRIPLEGSKGNLEIVVTEDGNDTIIDYPIETKNYTINSIRLPHDRVESLIEAIVDAHSKSAKDLIAEAVEKAQKDRD